MAEFTFTVNLKGLDALTEGMMSKADAVVSKVANDIRNDVISAMSGAKSGRIYTRYGRAHQASAPGEAPAVDTGALKNSVQVLPKSRDAERTVAVGQEYGLYLELGTRFMEPRPFMAPAFKAREDEFEAAIKSILQ